MAFVLSYHVGFSQSIQPDLEKLNELLKVDSSAVFYGNQNMKNRREFLDPGMPPAPCSWFM